MLSIRKLSANWQHRFYCRSIIVWEILFLISSADNRCLQKRFAMTIGIALHDLHSFGELSASIHLPQGWLKDNEVSQKAFRSCRVNGDGFPNVANGSRCFAEDPDLARSAEKVSRSVKQGPEMLPEHCDDMPKHPDVYYTFYEAITLKHMLNLWFAYVIVWFNSYIYVLLYHST